MLRSFRRKFGKKAPDWLLCLALIPWRMVTRCESAFITPVGNSWFLIHKMDDSKIFVPMNRLFSPSWPATHYEKYFKVEQGDVVLDAGACVGEFAIPVAKRAKLVLAIEPEPQNIKYLKRGIEMNKLDNIVIVERAVWNCKKRMRLNISDSIGSHSLVADVGQESIEVQADTIDGICQELGIEKPNFVKLDIKGAEVEALRGGSDSIRNADKVVLETHIRNGKSTVHDVVEILSKHGFKMQIESPSEKHEIVYARK